MKYSILEIFNINGSDILNMELYLNQLSRKCENDIQKINFTIK